MLVMMQRLALLLLVPLLIVGCDKKPETAKVVVEKNVARDDRSVDTERAIEQFEPIPEDQPEAVSGERPSPRHVWVPGSWERMAGQWEWRPGGWHTRPDEHAEWHPGHWQWNDDEWRWHPGHWAIANTARTVMEIVPMPELLPETIPPKPDEMHHWVAGYWDWDGRWIWIPGYWTTKPHPSAEWVPGHWDEYGAGAGFRWIGGHWRVKG